MIREEAELLVVANESLPKIPDSDDIEILAYASGGQANIFVTGDKALLELKAIEKYVYSLTSRVLGEVENLGVIDRHILHKSPAIEAGFMGCLAV